jgi:hypothetical protein
LFGWSFSKLNNKLTLLFEGNLLSQSNTPSPLFHASGAGNLFAESTLRRMNLVADGDQA